MPSGFFAGAVVPPGLCTHPAMCWCQPSPCVSLRNALQHGSLLCLLGISGLMSGLAKLNESV